MLASALKILRSINRNIRKIQTFATRIFAFDFIVCTFEIIVVLIGVVAKTFGGRTNRFTS
jgi:hypothetical protein